MKKNILTFILIVVCFTTGILAQNTEFVKSNFPGREREFREARANFIQGQKYYEIGKGMYPVALDFFLKAQAFNPNNAELNYLIGVCYLNSVQKTQSTQYFQKALSLAAEQNPDARFLLGQAYQVNYEWDNAIRCYQEYKSGLSPNDLKSAGPDVDKKIQECNTGKELVKKPVRVFIDNLGTIINSVYPEYSPLVNADESLLFFTSRRDNTLGGKKDEVDLGYYEDIYIAEKVGTTWGTPKNPSQPLNSKKHDATVGLAPDGQTLLVYKGSNGGDIYQCVLKGDHWSKPRKIGGKINTKDHESSGSLSFDGRTLYFVSDREGGYGGRDIYYSVKDKAGNWGNPVNIGAVINTAYDEEGVFIHPDGRTLYFSSRGHKTMGGFDIFKTVNTNGVWSEPENIGYPINTPDDDVFFSITASGLHGFYSSVKAEGLGGQDLYLITFLGPDKPVINGNEDNLLASLTKPVKEVVIEAAVEIKDNQVTVLKGKVLDEVTGNPVGAVIEITDNERNEVIASFESNSSTGKYLISLPSGKNYGIAVKATGYLFHSENLNIPPSTTYREVEKDIRLKKMEIGSSIVLNNIFFDFGKSTLRPESYPELDRLVKLMNDYPTLKIEISGHTDNVGSAAFNKKLSEERAKSVVDYLVSKGVNISRLTYAGYGFDKPIAPNTNEEGRQLNRRTEFKILSI